MLINDPQILRAITIPTAAIAHPLAENSAL